MKILEIVSSGFEEGGVENGIVLLRPLFIAKGNEDRVMASDRRMDLPRFDDYTFKSVNRKGIGRYFYYAFNPHSFFILKKILKEYKPDIVQLHTMGEISPSVLFLLKKIPTVLSIHGPEAFAPSLRQWYLPTASFKDGSHNPDTLTIPGKLRNFYYDHLIRPLYRIHMSNINFLVYSRYMQKTMKEDGIDAAYIPYGVKLLKQKPLPDTDVIAFVGRLEKIKGLDQLLRAMPEILKKRPQTHLMIAGDGEYRKEFEAIVHELHLEDSVEFLGHLSRPQTEAVYDKSTMLIVPSIWAEAFGKVGIEAMSVGRPVIASNVGGMSDWLIDGKTGYLIPPKNPHLIASAVIDLLSDRKKLHAMSEQARIRSEVFNLELHADQMIEFYKKVIAQKKTV